MMKPFFVINITTTAIVYFISFRRARRKNYPLFKHVATPNIDGFQAAIETLGETKDETDRIGITGGMN